MSFAYISARIKADIHGLSYLLRWPPIPHQVAILTCLDGGWIVYCHDCHKIFGRKWI
jgi:hypothetical protein